MRIICALLFTVFLMSSCSRTIYIVRHAEKTLPNDTTVKMMANDPPLSEAGKVRAFVLRDELKSQHIRHIYSTNTLRTVSTADPLRQAINVKVEIYNTRDSLDYLVQQLKNEKGNALVIGHSNTVDDIVNKLTGKTSLPGDLKDYEYDNMFIVHLKGKKARFEKKKYGYPSNPEK
jgi:2,3-bisphosphoglycerate-dependent phosphoglycerate mutase